MPTGWHVNEKKDLDQIAIHKMQMAKANLGKGEAVELVEGEAPEEGRHIGSRRPSKRLEGLMDESPPASPATLKRRASKDAQKDVDQGDVLAVLGIQKDD